MCTTSTACPADAIDLSRIDWDIGIVGDPARELIAHYRVTCWDRETGTFIGEAIAPPVPGGGPPSVTIADVVDLIGGYRLASIIVKIDAERLTRRSQRASDAVRRWRRVQRRRALRRAFAEIDEHFIPGGRI